MFPLGGKAYEENIPMTVHAATRWALRDLPNLFSLLVFFAATALLFRSQQFALVVTASLGFHELGHAAALAACGLDFRITFGVVGAWTWSSGPERERLSHLTNAIIHLAGPFFSLLLAVLALGLHMLWQPSDHHLLTLANFSAQVGFLNLLPIGPLSDGGKLVRRMIASLDGPRRWRVVMLPMVVTALMLVFYALVVVPRVPGDYPAPYLLGLLLVGLWMAGSLWIETHLSRPPATSRSPVVSRLAVPPRTPGSAGENDLVPVTGMAPPTPVAPSTITAPATSVAPAIPVALATPVAPVSSTRPVWMTPRQVYVLLFLMWGLLMLGLIVTAATPFWLGPDLVLGSLRSVVTVLKLLQLVL